MEYFGVTLSEVQIPDQWVYYEATDSYYSNHSDAYRVHSFHVTKVEYPDIHMFRVYYTVEPMCGAYDPVTGEPVTEAVLTLCGKAGGGFMVLSNRALSGETESGYDLPLSQLAFDNLDLNAWPGIGFNLCYESESLIVFYGEQGLFGYDPEQGKVVFEVDFIKAFGKMGVIQGSHGTGVSVDADGENLILSFRDPDDSGDQEVYFIHIPTLTYRKGRDLPMKDVFQMESVEGYVMPYGRLGDTVYVRGDQRWAVFEGYGESR